MKILVYENLDNNEKLMGYLNVDNVRGHLSTSFEYDNNYLESKNFSFKIDPEIENYKGSQWTKNEKGLFRIFLDECPDRWGRKLIEKKENKNNLSEIDYLLNVSDTTRMGCFRFKKDINGDFLSSDNKNTVPPISNIRELEDASFAFEKNDDKNLWIKQLFYEGSSLGGARPKANIYDENKELYIAKFPSIKDEYDVELFEKISFDLAKICGINVPDSKVLKVSDKGNIFLSKRFDREKLDKEKVVRKFYMSALTAIGKNDGDDASYIDIVTYIRENIDNPIENLRELYKRLIFNVITKNTDDHLRNHAFIYENGKLSLSPAFDLNINIYKTNSLALNIDENSSDASLDLVLSTAKYYGINNDDANKLIQNMKMLVKTNFKKLCDKYQVKQNEYKMIENIILKKLALDPSPVLKRLQY